MEERPGEKAAEAIDHDRPEVGARDHPGPDRQPHTRLPRWLGERKYRATAQRRRGAMRTGFRVLAELGLATLAFGIAGWLLEVFKGREVLEHTEPVLCTQIYNLVKREDVGLPVTILPNRDGTGYLLIPNVRGKNLKKLGNTPPRGYTSPIGE